MFNHYLWLAARSLRRSPVLTALMIAAIGIGIGTTMTMLTIFRAMGADPIPQKSARLFVPQIDNWGPSVTYTKGEPQDQLSYADAQALLAAGTAPRQSASYRTGFAVTPDNPDLQAFKVRARAASPDFFPMFDVPFRYGGPWHKAEEDARADVVVLAARLNEKLFGGVDSIGKLIRLDGHDYHVIGVMAPWSPVPRFYDVNDSGFGDIDDVFLPFATAIERHAEPSGGRNCAAEPPSGWDGFVHSECGFIKFWAELAEPADAAAYRRYLEDYAREQRKLGRFSWPPNVRLRNLPQWLSYQHVVSDEARLLVIVSFSFLFVCLVNAVGLMLAKFMGRAAEIGVRRALGANRRAIFLQCLIETGVIGAAGGILGLMLTALGLIGVRAVLSDQARLLTQLDLPAVGLTLALAVIAALCAGLYPTWRAARVQPALQIKVN